jgi:hypothetical protein
VASLLLLVLCHAEPWMVAACQTHRRICCLLGFATCPPQLHAVHICCSLTACLSAGHGTHVAGIVGARNGGAGGIVGVAPGVGIFSIKILDAQGVGELCTRIRTSGVCKACLVCHS